MPNAVHVTVWEFAGGAIDLRARTLRVNDQIVRVEPKVFDLIAYLVANHGRAIGRDELIAAVWGVVEVNDAVLAQVMRKARKAVGDSGDGQTHIQTIVRFGYRWIAATRAQPPASDVLANAVESDVTPTATLASTPTQPPPPSTPPRARAALRLVMTAVLVVAALAYWRFGIHREAPAPPTTASLAVLPTRVVSSDASEQWASAGLMALLRDRLTKSRRIALNSDSDIQTLVRSAAPGPQQRDRAREWMGAHWVLETTLLQTRPQWRIGYTLWEGQRAVTQDTVAATEMAQAAGDVATAVLKHIDGDSPAIATASSHDAIYARAAAQVLSGDLDGGRRALLALLPEDPAPLRAQVLLAEVERRLGHADEARQRLNALALDMRGNELEPAQLDALRVLGRLELQQRHLTEAEQVFTRLISAANGPDSASWRADAFSGLAFVAQRRQRIDQATEFYGRARAIRHSSGDRFALAKQDANEGVFALEQGRALVALDRLRKANEAFEQLGLKQETAMTLFDMAQASAERGQLADQRAMHLAALAIYQVLNDDYGVLRTHVRQMYADYLAGQFQAGLKTADHWVTEARRLNYPTVEAEALLNHAMLLSAQLQWPAAEAKAREAISVYTKAEAYDGADEATRALALILARQGKRADALAALEQNLHARDTAPAQAANLLALGNVHAASGSTEQAYEAWQQAHTLATTHAIDSVRIEAGIALANHLVAHNQLDAAEPLIGELTTEGAETYDVERLRARYLSARKDPAATGAWQRVEALRGERSVEARAQ